MPKLNEELMKDPAIVQMLTCLTNFIELEISHRLAKQTISKGLEEDLRKRRNEAFLVLAYAINPNLVIQDA